METKIRRRTSEQHAAERRFREIVAAHYPSRFPPVTLDEEGWPRLVGRRTREAGVIAQVEWHDENTIAIYDRRSYRLPKYLRIVGVIRHQMGEEEYRLLAPATRIELAMRVMRDATPKSDGQPSRGQNQTPAGTERPLFGARIDDLRAGNIYIAAPSASS